MSDKSIGWAVNQLLAGKPVQRAGWPNETSCIRLVGEDPTRRLVVGYKETAGDFELNWLPHVEDLLTADWKLA
jgi:hypothetical protein